MPSRTDQISAGAPSAIQNSSMRSLGINETNPSDAADTSADARLARKTMRFIAAIIPPHASRLLSSRDRLPFVILAFFWALSSRFLLPSARLERRAAVLLVLRQFGLRVKKPVAILASVLIGSRTCWRWHNSFLR